MIWANELYPTTVRSSGLGVVFGFGLIGGYVSPYIVELSKSVIESLNPVITLGVIGLFCSGPAFFLKETLGKPLLDEIKEMTRRYSVRYLFKNVCIKI